MSQEAKGAPSAQIDKDLQAVDALVNDADGDQIWQVLDYAERRSVPVAEAYHAILGDLPEREAD